MKRLIFILALLFSTSAQAQVTSGELMGLGMPALLAQKVATIADGTGLVLKSEERVKGATAAGVVTNLMGLNSGDNLEINAPAGENIVMSHGGTSALVVSGNIVYPATGGAMDLGNGTYNFDDANFGGTVTAGGLDISGETVLADLTLPIASDGFWSVQTGANTACATTCTLGACVFGLDTDAGNLTSCATGTADMCVCAGN
jgi:hypothetical protein